MKKRLSPSKLRIHRETIRSLQERQLQPVAGAATQFDYCTSVGPGCSDYSVNCTQNGCATTNGPGCYSHATCGTALC
ncbi:MAG: class I lanthipeptide [Thermoanaerobaculia bacterium]